MDYALLLDRGAYGLDVLLTSSLRYFAATSVAFVVFWVVLRERLGHRRIQAKFPARKKIAYDVGHSVIGLLAIVSATTVMSVLRPLGFMQIYDDPGAHGWGYFAFTVALLIVGHDAYTYWTHRLIHRKSLFRRMHAVHHRSVNPSPFTAYSVDAVEGVIHGVYLPLMAVFLPLHLWAVAIFLAFMTLANVYLHLGYEVMPRWFARNPVTRWLATSTFHNLHHQRSRCNYAPYFTWWDRWMGTIYADYEGYYEQITARPLLDAPTPVTGRSPSPGAS
ncbi:MAG: sterol desaturase family protein [Myxococcota bacterium]